MFASLHQQNVVLESTQSSTPKKYNSNSSLKIFLRIRLMFSQTMVLEMADFFSQRITVFHNKHYGFPTKNDWFSPKKVVFSLPQLDVFPQLACVFLPKKNLCFSPKMNVFPKKMHVFPTKTGCIFSPKKGSGWLHHHRRPCR